MTILIHTDADPTPYSQRYSTLLMLLIQRHYLDVSICSHFINTLLPLFTKSSRAFSKDLHISDYMSHRLVSIKKPQKKTENHRTTHDEIQYPLRPMESVSCICSVAYILTFAPHLITRKILVRFMVMVFKQHRKLGW